MEKRDRGGRRQRRRRTTRHQAHYNPTSFPQEFPVDEWDKPRDDQGVTAAEAVCPPRMSSARALRHCLGPSAAAEADSPPPPRRAASAGDVVAAWSLPSHPPALRGGASPARRQRAGPERHLSPSPPVVGGVECPRQGSGHRPPRWSVTASDGDLGDVDIENFLAVWASARQEGGGAPSPNPDAVVFDPPPMPMIDTEETKDDAFDACANHEFVSSELDSGDPPVDDGGHDQEIPLDAESQVDVDVAFDASSETLSPEHDGDCAVDAGQDEILLDAEVQIAAAPPRTPPPPRPRPLAQAEDATGDSFEGNADSGNVPPEDNDDPAADEGQDQEILLDAEVEAVAGSQHEEEEKEEEEPAMVCGVPVARPILSDLSADGDDGSGGCRGGGERGERDGSDLSNFENSQNRSTDENDRVMTAHVDKTTHPHLQYMGNVVMAIMDESDGVEEDNLEGGSSANHACEVESGGSSRSYDRDDRPHLPLEVDSEATALATDQQGPSESSLKDQINRHNRVLWGAVIFFVAVICGAVGMGTQSRGDGDDGGAPSVPSELSGTPTVVVNTVTPPLTPPPAPLSDDYASMARLLDPFLRTTESYAHRVEGTPQNAALRWVDATSRGEAGHFDLREWADGDDAEGDNGGPRLVLPPEQLGRLIQRYALAVLYYSTAGELDDEWEPLVGWRDDANFLTDAHECAWSSSVTPGLGVTCDGNHRVMEVFLEDNGLAGTLPPNELHGLSELRRLVLSSNPEVKGPLPESLGRLPRLEYLFLGQNSLTGTVPSSYGNLATLKEFSLAGNKLAGSIPSEVSGMKSLTKIRLNRNDFTGGMNNFCHINIQGIILFSSDCFCRSFPKVESEVDCGCCTICCAGEWAEEYCHPKVPCTGEDCSYCSRR